MAKSTGKGLDTVRDDAGQGFIFVPLGGTGEIGMNFNLYGCDGSWMAVDCGIGFAGPDMPETEILLPDPAFIVEQRDSLLGIVVTHVHEDHIGGIARLWPQLRCPVFCTPFAAAVIRRKLNEVGLIREVKLNIVQPGGSFVLGPFQLRYLAMTHSTPESQALAITTRYGTVLHTGDWKFDPSPIVGGLSDEAGLKALGDAGVLAIVSDSTNATVEGHSGSELDVKKSLEMLLMDLPGRVAVTCFASNIARVASVLEAGVTAGRHVALIGRSLGNYIAAAQEAGYLQDAPDFVPEKAIGGIPDDNLLLLITGSQGEPRAALSRIAADTHPHAVLGKGDTVIFSSRVIPGNERAIAVVRDGLAKRGVNVITDDDEFTHVSGHPARDELRKLYKLVRPQYVIPTHGTWRHLSTHAALAQEEGIATVLIENGDVLQFGPGGRPAIVDAVPTGRLAVDGDRIVPLKGGIMANRRRMLLNGAAIGSFVIDGSGKLLGTPKISAPGLLDDVDIGLRQGMEAEFGELLKKLPAGLRRDNAAFADAAKAGLRKIIGKHFGKRPWVDVHAIQV
jgi:ribonuclease J